MRTTSVSLREVVAVALILVSSSTVAGFCLQSARAQTSATSQWTGQWDAMGTLAIPSIPGPLTIRDSGTFTFSIILASSSPGGNGSGSGHYYLSGQANGCTFAGDTAYSFSLDAVYDPTSGNVTLSGGSPIPSTIDVTETCQGFSAQLPFDTAGFNLGNAADVKLEDGATWNENFGVTGYFTSVQLTGLIHGSDLPLSPVNAGIASPIEGYNQSNFVVGQFKDSAGSSASASDFSATIDWGDSSPKTSGAVTQVGAGLFNVTGTHLYKEAMKFTVSVAVADPDGSGVTLNNPVYVQDADLKAADVNSFLASPTVGFSGTIAKFTDGNPKAPASDFTITIDWGDGTANSSGVAVPAGVLGRSIFNITGTHTYGSSGTYSVSAKIVDKDSSIETANSTAYVGTSPPSTTSTSSTASSQQGGGGGIPEFPFQALAATLFTVLIAITYILVRRGHCF